MIVFPMRGAHTGDLVMALPAIGAALAWGPVTVSGLAPRYYFPFRSLPVDFRFAPESGHVLRPARKRDLHRTDLWLSSLPQPAEPIRLSLPLFGTENAETILPGRDWVLLSPWADFRPKQWRVQRWRAVAESALGLGYRVAVLGPPGAARMCADIAQQDCLDLVGKDAPDTWPALLARASLVISTDTASCHVADALGVPVIGLYGHTAVAEYGPYWNREYCLNEEGMDAIGADQVIGALHRWHETSFPKRNMDSTKT